MSPGQASPLGPRRAMVCRNVAVGGRCSTTPPGSNVTRWERVAASVRAAAGRGAQANPRTRRRRAGARGGRRRRRGCARAPAYRSAHARALPSVREQKDRPRARAEPAAVVQEPRRTQIEHRIAVVQATWRAACSDGRRRGGDRTAARGGDGDDDRGGVRLAAVASARPRR